MELTPTTELEAVNEMLTAIGEVPVNTLSVSGPTDAAIARDTLLAGAREVQSVGWYFNTEDARVFTADVSGAVTILPNTLSIRPTRTRELIETRRIVQRGTTLFDLTNNTAIFGDANQSRPITRSECLFGTAAE